MWWSFNLFLYLLRGNYVTKTSLIECFIFLLHTSIRKCGPGEMMMKISKACVRLNIYAYKVRSDHSNIFITFFALYVSGIKWYLKIYCFSKFLGFLWFHFVLGNITDSQNWPFPWNIHVMKDVRCFYVVRNKYGVVIKIKNYLLFVTCYINGNRHFMLEGHDNDCLQRHLSRKLIVEM